MLRVLGKQLLANAPPTGLTDFIALLKLALQKAGITKGWHIVIRIYTSLAVHTVLGCSQNIFIVAAVSLPNLLTDSSNYS